MEAKTIEVTQEMLEQALLCCAKDEPAEKYPCEDCYLYPLSKDGQMSTGETCFKHLALDAIAYIRRINDFEKSQCAHLLAKLDEETSRRYQAECNYDHAIKDRDMLRKALELAVEESYGAPAPREVLDELIQDAKEDSSNG